MIKDEYDFLSADGETRIHMVSWMPEREVCAVLQICHGMTEYIERYEPFAAYLAERGFYVVGHDHLGHGRSVRSPERLGYFHEKDGNRCLIEDIHKVRTAVQDTNPDFPYFILGHSMGSFLVRQYLTEHGDRLDGAILIGTGHMPLPLLLAGQAVCAALAQVKGWEHRSRFVTRLVLGSYNKAFSDQPGNDWLSRDKDVVAAYDADPLCGFTFTLNAYYHMFAGMRTLMRPGALKKIPVNLPVLFASGREDPVGGRGKGVIKVCDAYRKNQIQDVRIKLYKDDRHEILNELDREIVYDDIYRWMERRFGSRDLEALRVIAGAKEEPADEIS